MSLAEQPQSYADEAVQKYGYKQEYRRDLKRFASFAVGFSFISMTALTVHLLILRLCRW